jgi:ubiquinone/menaquinone biosynthesis C-methylase UbiE
MTFVDIGCGDGFFTIPAARIIGAQGRAYGIDQDETKIAQLKEKARIERLEGLHAIIGKAEDRLVCEGCADIAFFGIVLHDFADLPKVLRSARRMLKANGQLVDLDWKKKPMPFGPPVHIRFSAEEAKSRLEEADFRILSIKEVGLYSYLVVSTPEKFEGHTGSLAVESPGKMTFY